jgi:nitrite reductase/ring-hydroxylating ferredoxin subunit
MGAEGDPRAARFALDGRFRAGLLSALQNNNREDHMAFQTVAKIADIQPGTMKSVAANGKKLLVAHVDGAFYAMQQRCPHLGGNLSRGRLEGKTVTCPLHKATFDLTTGEVIDVAHLLFLKFKTKQAATYPVKIDGDSVMVDV